MGSDADKATNEPIEQGKSGFMLTGDAIQSSLLGFDENDALNGNDRMWGGISDEALFTHDGADLIFGESGSDVVSISYCRYGAKRTEAEI